MFQIIYFLIFQSSYTQEDYLCGKGERQSPISVIDTFDAKYYKLELRFKEDILIAKLPDDDDENYKNQSIRNYIYKDDPNRQIPEFRMLGHDPHGLMVGYRPTEFELISPAEHQIFEKNYDLELVIWGELLNIYKNPNIIGGLSLLFSIVDETQEENSTLVLNQSIFETQIDNEEIDDDKLALNMINLAAQLKNTDKYIAYRGSLTWGNCDEIVDRFLIPYPLKITQEQFDKLINSKIINTPNKIQETRKRRIIRGTLIIEDETSANYNPFYRYLSLAFIAFLFFLIFALFIKEQREKRRIEQAKKFKGGN